MFRKIFNLSLIITLAVSVALAQQTATTQSTPSVERLREHVTYLASDKLEGRRTGTTGADEAGKYIAAEFSRLGLRPGGQANSNKMRTVDWRQYLQPFPYVAGVDLGKDNLLTSTLADSAFLRVGEDWMPLGLSANGRV